MPGMKEMSLERAWKIFKKRGMYDDVHVKYALDRLTREIFSHFGGCVIPDIEIMKLNGEWYGIFEEKARPLLEVMDMLEEMKKPDGTIIRVRVYRPE